MISFQEYRPKPEVRESYTDQVVAASVARASGAKPSAAVAAIEAAAGLWERAFASARSETLTAGQLALIGRSLLLRGEAVWHVSRGRRLAPASSFAIQGGLFPESWTYRLNLAGPATTRTVSATAGTVFHARLGLSPTRPWAGCSPLTACKQTVDALAYVERSLAEEHSGPVGSIMAVADPEESTQVASAIGAAAGDVLLGESASTGLAGDPSRNDWNPHRFGPAPSQGTTVSRDSLERAIWAACGVPVELLRPSSGVDAREAWRRFLFSTVAPIGEIISAELKRLGLASELDWTELRASDLQSRARSYKQLTDSGVAAARAEQLCGFN